MVRARRELVWGTRSHMELRMSPDTLTEYSPKKLTKKVAPKPWA